MSYSTSFKQEWQPFKTQARWTNDINRAFGHDETNTELCTDLNIFENDIHVPS